MFIKIGINIGIILELNSEIYYLHNIYYQPKKFKVLFLFLKILFLFLLKI